MARLLQPQGNRNRSTTHPNPTASYLWLKALLHSSVTMSSIPKHHLKSGGSRHLPLCNTGQRRRIFSWQHSKHKAISKAAQPMCRSNNNLPRNLGVHPNLPAMTSWHRNSLLLENSVAMGRGKVLVTVFIGSFRSRTKGGLKNWQLLHNWFRCKIPTSQKAVLSSQTKGHEFMRKPPK